MYICIYVYVCESNKVSWQYLFFLLNFLKPSTVSLSVASSVPSCTSLNPYNTNGTFLCTPCRLAVLPSCHYPCPRVTYILLPWYWYVHISVVVFLSQWWRWWWRWPCAAGLALQCHCHCVILSWRPNLRVPSWDLTRLPSMVPFNGRAWHARGEWSTRTMNQSSGSAQGLIGSLPWYHWSLELLLYFRVTYKTRIHT